MRIKEACKPIRIVITVIIVCLSILWYSLSGVKEEVKDLHQEMYELKTELVGALTENTKAIKRLSEMINQFLDNKEG